MNVEAEIDISSSKERVWAAITDIGNCVDMISGIVKINVLNQPDSGVVGLKWEETRVMFGKEAIETMWITDAVDNEYYQTRAESHGSIYISRMALDEQQGKTRLSMSFKAQAQSSLGKIMSAVMGVFFKGSMKKMIQKDLEDIKNHVENN